MNYLKLNYLTNDKKATTLGILYKLLTKQDEEDQQKETEYFGRKGTNLGIILLQLVTTKISFNGFQCQMVKINKNELMKENIEVSTQHFSLKQYIC